MRTLILLLFLLLSWDSFSQAIRGMSFDGNNIGTYLFPYQEYTFSRADSALSKWKFLITDKAGSKNCVVNESNDAKEFRVCLDENTCSWHKTCQRFYDATNDTCYYEAYIVAYNGEKADSLRVKLLCLPTKPIIKKILLSYEGYDSHYKELINPSIAVDIESQNAVRVNAMLSEFGELPTTAVPDFYLICHFNNESIEDTFSIDSLYCDVNQYICFYTHNAFGASVNSDTIYTNDFIDDIDILDDINNAVSIPIFPGESADDVFTAGNGMITLSSDMISEFSVYTLDGTVVMWLQYPEKGAAFRLERGIYLVKMKINDKWLLRKCIL